MIQPFQMLLNPVQPFGDLGSFTLDDDADPTLPNSRTFFVLPDGYAVSENAPPAAWGLANLACASDLAGVGGFTGQVSTFITDLSARTATIDNLAPGDHVLIQPLDDGTAPALGGSVEVLQHAVPDITASDVVPVLN